MNLLSDCWIPVRKGAEFKQINYKELLCSDQPDIQIALPRDDLELACIQMLAAMAQVIFMPENKKVLRLRIKTPLSENEYEEGVKKYKEWFDLEHPKWPFMQTINPRTKEFTDVQKLFPGLPAGNNHAFFNEASEYKKVCLSCAGIGLFNLCTNAPNISGKHKGGLRGGAPISTMIYSRDLRKMIWANVLSREMVDKIFIGQRDNSPVWVEPIKEKGKILSSSIGIIRGIFWAPVLVRLSIEEEKGQCDCCGLGAEKMVREFCLGSDFKFDIIGLWLHPFSPRQLNLQKENKKGEEKPEESIVSFRTTEPAWTQFSELLFQSPKTDKKEGFIPAAVVTQHCEILSGENTHLFIGGYRNKQAAILQRRHELYALPAGWNDNFRGKIIEVIEIGLRAEEILVNKVLYPVVKGNKDKGEKGVGVPINSKASVLFFHFSEPLIHRMLLEISLREFIQEKDMFLKDITDICIGIFGQVTQPFAHKPELIGTIALARVKLERMLGELKRTHTIIQGGGL